jgi:hypothetical protein
MHRAAAAAGTAHMRARAVSSVSSQTECAGGLACVTLHSVYATCTTRAVSKQRRLASLPLVVPAAPTAAAAEAAFQFQSGAACRGTDGGSARAPVVAARGSGVCCAVAAAEAEAEAEAAAAAAAQAWIWYPSRSLCSLSPLATHQCLPVGRSA